MKIAETKRLILREMTPHDAENAYLLNLDPDVVKYTGDVAFKSIEEAKNFLINYNHFKKYGFGRWAVIRKSDNEYLGWCGLKYSIDKDEYDLGYRFMKKYWGFGYATESSIKSLELGFNKFNIKCIVGRVMTDNLASIKVLEKIGMSFYKNETCGGEDGIVYKIDKEEFVSKNYKINS